MARRLGRGDGDARGTAGVEGEALRRRDDVEGEGHEGRRLAQPLAGEQRRHEGRQPRGVDPAAADALVAPGGGPAGEGPGILGAFPGPDGTLDPPVVRERPGVAGLARERAGTHQEGAGGVARDGDLPAQALVVGGEERRGRGGRVVEAGALVQALQPRAPRKDVGGRPRGAAQREMRVGHRPGKGTGEALVGCDDGGLARGPGGEARDEVFVREGVGRGGDRHAAIIVGRWLAP